MNQFSETILSFYLYHASMTIEQSYLPFHALFDSFNLNYLRQLWKTVYNLIENRTFPVVPSINFSHGSLKFNLSQWLTIATTESFPGKNSISLNKDDWIKSVRTKKQIFPVRCCKTEDEKSKWKENWIFCFDG